MNKEKQLTLDYREVFLGDAGQRVLEDLRHNAGLLWARVPMDNLGRIDPLGLAREDGKRAVLIHIYSKLNRDPNKEKQKGAINVEET